MIQNLHLIALGALIFSAIFGLSLTAAALMHRYRKDHTAPIVICIFSAGYAVCSWITYLMFR